jgi:glucose-6-phosphate 1-dehydrogenase
MENPFADGENRILKPSATAMVIFGASGDLTHRKLVPALANLAEDDYLPDHFVVVGASRSKISDEEFREKLYTSVSTYSRRRISNETWNKFSRCIYFQPVDGTKQQDFEVLKNRLEAIGIEHKQEFNYLYYLATAPEFFSSISSNLNAVGLIEELDSPKRKTQIVVEKPFGHDLESAKILNTHVRKNFYEEQVFRIDHYLGKETVQNILVFRFANGIFEPLWNRRYIDSIEISVCEEIGVPNRGEYFDKNGILRDIVQNHVFQILSLLCMEPPISLSDPDSIRDEKVKVLKMVKRFTAEDVYKYTVRAQYTKGYINGQEVNGYLDEQGVDAQSSTETYIALKLEIDNWRWFGVPIYIRVGKRLPKRISEISVFFKQAPASIFKGRQIDELAQNVLSIQVQPKEGISLTVNSKPPGPRMRVHPVEMDFNYDHSFGIASPEAYERLLLDAMKGDATLFTRNDEIEHAWDILSPILTTWTLSNPPPLFQYEAGSWGPGAAANLTRLSLHKWRRL